MMKLKFCGFTSIKDVTAASQLPIDAIGFIHYTAQNLLILYRKLKRNIQALKSLKL